MKARILGTAAALGLSVALVAPNAEAQVASASITATASIQVQLSAVAGGNLDFASVFPGATKTVLTSDAAAGSFELTGADNAEITVSFPVLPTDLSDGAAIPNLLPITFGGTAGASNSSVNNRTAGTVSFDPSVGQTARLSTAPAPVVGKMWVYLGGSVTPALQPAGVYTATVTLNAAYTGN